MSHTIINSRQELDKLLKSALKHTYDKGVDNPTPRDCPICRSKQYPVYFRGRIIYTGCDCKKARPYPTKNIKK